MSPSAPALSDAAIESLCVLADRLGVVTGPWWLIGGAAVALYGVGTDPLADIDVMMGASDARRVLQSLGVAPEAPGGSELFRSAVFGHWLGLPIPVDVMGDFEVRTGEVWRRVEPTTREPRTVAGRTLFVPSRRELAGILRLFGRPKDLARADLLSHIEECVPRPSRGLKARTPP
jgi:hypothetical protein